MAALELQDRQAASLAEGAIRSAQAPEPSKARNNDWDEYYSDSDRYELSDVFDEDVYRFIEDRITKRTGWARAKITISVASILLAALSLTLILFHIPAPLYDGSESSGVRLVVSLLVKWCGWSQSTTGTPYGLTTIVSLAIGFLSQQRLSAELEKKIEQYIDLIREVRTQTQDAKQIYPGSGTLTFTFGSEGLCASSRNVNLTIHWAAVLDFILLYKEQTKGGPVNAFRYATVDPEHAETATHVLLFLEPVGRARTDEQKDDEGIHKAEYLVIPRHFFHGGRNTRPWPEFVKKLREYLARVKTPDQSRSGD